jgi:aminopeptidase YwaD
MNESAKYSIDLVKSIIEKNGSRVSGTLGNHNSVIDLENELKTICSTVKRDSFSIHPDSLFLIGYIFASIYCIGLVTYLIDIDLLRILGFCIMLFGLCFCFSQFILYSNVFDWLFRKVEGMNLVGIVEPKNAVKKQILIVGHHDSSYIYPFHERYTELFPFRLFIPIVLFIFEFIILGLYLQKSSYYSIWISYVLIIGLVFVVPMFWYISRKPGLGAGDNLIGCTIGISIAKIFHTADSTLNNTRIMVLLTDGEEVGQKGSRYFVQENKALLADIETEVINIDSIYDVEDIILLSKDRNGFSKLSKKMNEKLLSIAKQNGYKWKVNPMPFGGGGTDGGQFAKVGIETASIIGTPIKAIRKEIIIHTSKDIPERIHIDAVESVIETVTEYIKAMDQEEL